MPYCAIRLRCVTTTTTTTTTTTMAVLIINYIELIIYHELYISRFQRAEVLHARVYSEYARACKA